MGKYSALGDFLRTQRLDEVPMTFDRIEKVSGTTLPPSARRHRAWWSNNPRNSVMTKVWLEAGFESGQVDLEGRRLVFRRVRPAEKAMLPEQRKTNSPVSPHRHPMIGALKGLIQIEPGTDLTAPADPHWGERNGAD